MAIFTPENEPYLGRVPVSLFDHMLPIFIDEQVRIAAWTHDHDLTPLQGAASELVPSASSIALSIRELVRQGYLMSALILTRPLMERVATLSYLIEHPTKVDLWKAGWPHKSRPSLKERVQAMIHVSGAPPPEGAPPSEAEISALIDRYNSMVHGDPQGALHGAVLLESGRAGYTIGKDLGSPNRADDVCIETVCWINVLLGRCAQLFPDVPRSTPTPGA